MDNRSALWLQARKLLKFSTPGDPAQLSAFVNLLVLNPSTSTGRGIEVAGIYRLSLPCGRVSGSGEIVQDRPSADRRRTSWRQPVRPTSLGIGAGASDSQPKEDAKTVSAKPQPTVSVTATEAASAAPEPTPAVTETVEVEVTETVTAATAYDNSSGGSDSNDECSGGGGSVSTRTARQPEPLERRLSTQASPVTAAPRP